MKINQLISGLDEAKGSRLATAPAKPQFRTAVTPPQPTNTTAAPNLTVVPGGKPATTPPPATPPSTAPTGATSPEGTPLSADDLKNVADTPAPDAPAKSSGWDTAKAFGRGALNALRGTGNVASEIGQAITAPVGAAAGGLVRGYQTARAGQPFSTGSSRGPGYTGGVGASSGGSGGAGQDEVNQLRATIARLDQRLTRAGIAEKKTN